MDRDIAFCGLPDNIREQIRIVLREAAQGNLNVSAQETTVEFTRRKAAAR